MRTVVTLTLAFLKEHPVRLLLTTLATAAATCLVLWVVASYQALLSTYDEYASLALGQYELAIAPISLKPKDFVPADCLQEFRSDPDVRVVDTMWARRLSITDVRSCDDSADNTVDRSAVMDSTPAAVRPPSESAPNQPQFSAGPGSGPDARQPESLFLATEARQPPFELQDGRWLQTDDKQRPEVIVRTDVAEHRGIRVGDIVTVRPPNSGATERENTELDVVGILAAPTLEGSQAAGIPLLAPGSGEFFISTSTAETLCQESAQISLLAVSVRPDVDITEFRFSRAPKLNRYSTPVQFQEAYEIEEALDESSAARNVRVQSFAATGVATFVSMLVILCTLSMGVTERIRQYAVLRAIAFTRLQVACMIVLEGVILGLLGLVGGLLAGWAVLVAVATFRGEVLKYGVPIGSEGLWLAALATVGSGILASAIPAWRTTRVKPLDAMSPRPNRTDGIRVRSGLIAAGIALVAVNPLLAFVIPPEEHQLVIWLATGFLCMAVGFVLLAPSVVALIDQLCSPVLSTFLRIDHKLAASQITVHLWRTVGAATTMAFGAGLFIAIHVWGTTMLQSFIPGNWVPDAIVTLPQGLSPAGVAKIAELPDVDTDRCLAMVAEQPRLQHDLTGSADRATVTRQDNIVLAGLDPLKAIGGDHPLLSLDWTEGDPNEVARQMQQQRACVVPDHFLTETGLALGDSFALVPPENSEAIVEYTIAGVVRLPGWHWQTKLTGLRNRTHRAAALVFAGYDFVAQDFAHPQATHVWFSYESPDVDPAAVAQAVRTTVEDVTNPDKSRSSAGTLQSQDKQPRVIPVQGIRDHIDHVARRWIWLISQVPLISLCIASLGVVNVLLASVRSRRWEYGVLRSVGVTRSELARAVLVEGLLIAAVATVMSLAFGLLAGWCGCGLAQYASFFGGLHPPLVIPMEAVLVGPLLILLVAILSSVWPAWLISRPQPLQLLQEGLGEF